MAGKAFSKTSQLKPSKRWSDLRDEHLRIAKNSLRKLQASPLSSLMTCTVIAIALLLPAMLYALNTNLAGLLSQFRSSSQITLYLQEEVTENKGIELSEDLLTRLGIESSQYISKSAALALFSARSGLGDLISALDDNPLPAAIVIIPSSADNEVVNDLYMQLQDLVEVELAQLDSQWLQRLSSIVNLVNNLSQTLGVIISLAVIFLVGNTIKLHIEGRRDEIRVIKLVGGTDQFVTRPFLYTGFFYGLAGGVIACLLQFLLLLSFSGALNRLLSLYDTDFVLQGFSLLGFIVLLTAGAALGWFGALLSSWLNLRSINP